jgi:hypothetical protein
MRRITVSISDETYQRARKRAAEFGLPVEDLVLGFLERLTIEELDHERRRQLQTEIRTTVKRFRAASRPDRDRIHSR